MNRTASAIKRIVVAFDGSDLAKRAFAYAVMLAERIGSKVTGLHVIELARAHVPASAPMAGEMALTQGCDLEAARRRAKAIDEEFEDMAEYCFDRGVIFEQQRREGNLSNELLSAVMKDDLLAIGQKGRMAKAGIGSMARSLIKRAPCPVLMASGELRPVMRIVAAFDGSEPSRRAVRLARELAEAADLPLNVLSVGGVTWSADETLQAAQEIAGDAQVIAVGRAEGPEAEQIMEVAQRAGLAIFVLGAYPESWLHELLFGGSTDQVLRELHAPVIVVH